MIAEIAAVKENYKRMQDNQLVKVMAEDGHLLMPEAFEILKAEFEKRKLDKNIVEAAEQKKIMLHHEAMEKIKNSNPADFDKAIFEYQFSEKQKGTPAKTIIEGLVERGMDPDEAVTTESSFNVSLEERIKKCNNRMMINGGLLLLGIFISLLSYTDAMVNGGRTIVFTGLLFFSVAGFFKAHSEKSKYLRMQKN